MGGWQRLKGALIAGLALVWTLGAATAWAEPAKWAMDSAKSRLKFFAIQNGAPVEGEFKRFAADIRFDPEQLLASKFRVEVDIASVTAGYDEVVKNLAMPEWFSAEAFPKAVFESGSITRIPDTDHYVAEGMLTLKGKAMPLTLNFILEKFDGEIAVATGGATVKRLDFGVGQGEWAKPDVVRDEVRVEFRLAAKRQQ